MYNDSTRIPPAEVMVYIVYFLNEYRNYDVRTLIKAIVDKYHQPVCRFDGNVPQFCSRSPQYPSSQRRLLLSPALTDRGDQPPDTPLSSGSDCPRYVR